ncbi:MAG TPA: hypothetical protein PKA64_06495, partial [Myxococcota bacterium]|nr:hypothetical protein [Myxococcota bacterium]
TDTTPVDDTDTTPVDDTDGGETGAVEVPEVCATGTDRRGPLLAIFGDQLAEVDVITGAATPTGVTLSAADLVELAWDPASNAWYALRRGVAGPTLATVDLCTGAVTDVAPLQVAGTIFAAEAFTIDAAGVAVVSVSLNAADSLSETLADVDLQTGALSNLRPLDTAQDDLDEMFTDGGVWGADAYLCPGGWCTQVGAVDAAGAMHALTTLALHLTTLTFDADATAIYAYNLDQGADQDALYRIDPSTGAETLLGPIDPVGLYTTGPLDLIWAPDLCCPVDDTGGDSGGDSGGDTTRVVDTGDTSLVVDTGLDTGETALVVDSSPGETGESGELPEVCPTDTLQHGPLLALFGAEVGELDPVTGVATPTGVTLARADVYELAIDPTTGALYGLRTPAAPTLVRVELCTGEVIDLAPLSYTGALFAVEGMTIDALGRAVASASLNAADSLSESLLDLDLVTGALTNPRALDTQTDDVDEMFTDGAPWGADSWVCGGPWCTQIGPIAGNGALTTVGSYTLHLTTLTFDADATAIYAYNLDQGATADHLYHVDPSTGAATALGPVDAAHRFASRLSELLWLPDLCCPVEDTGDTDLADSGDTDLADSG